MSANKARRKVLAEGQGLTSSKARRKVLAEGQGLILKTSDIGEDSFVIRLLEGKLGKQEYLVQGGKKMNSKLAPLLQPLALVKLWTVVGKGNIPRIIDVNVQEDFYKIKKRPLSLRFSLRALDMLDQVSYPMVDSTGLLAATIRLFSILKTASESKEIKKLWIYFELLILDYLGARPKEDTLTFTSLNRLARHLEERIKQALR